MREIRFRAWDNHSKVMLTWDDIYPGHKVILSNLLNNLCKHIKPMQYTGLKDKKGKQLYEGDIVEVYGYKQKNFNIEDDGGNHYTITGVVRFMPSKGFCLKIIKMHDTDNDEPMTFSPYGYITQSSCKLLGNIYENLKLI